MHGTHMGGWMYNIITYIHAHVSFSAKDLSFFAFFFFFFFLSFSASARQCYTNT